MISSLSFTCWCGRPVAEVYVLHQTVFQLCWIHMLKTEGVQKCNITLWNEVT